jgi:O-acetyl-ADP-ribose deacetylase (regulator of RNase III)
VVHVVNDKTPNWGGGGFAEAVKRRWPDVQDDFRESVNSDRESLRLGSVRICAAEDGIFIASVVAQKGYGESVRPRIRYAALRKGLEAVAAAAVRHQATVHLPRIGAGQGRGSWAVIEDIIQTVFGEAHVSATIYDLPGAPIPERMPLQEELSFAQHP